MSRKKDNNRSRGFVNMTIRKYRNIYIYISMFQKINVKEKTDFITI
jgi:hypothetical protein